MLQKTMAVPDGKEGVDLVLLIHYLMLAVSIFESHQTEDNKIIGGERTGLIPFMISVQRGGGHICGGTLLSYRLTLTACHCLGDFKHRDDHNSSILIPIKHPAGPYLLQAGDWVLNRNNEHSQRRVAKEILIHPKCSREEGVLVYDFGLIVVRDEFVQSQYVQPLKLKLDHNYYDQQTRHILSQDDCWVIGWGKTDQDKPYMSQFLKKARMRFIGDRDCQLLLSMQNEAFSTYNFSAHAQVCAVGVNWNESDCSGDSGGPVWCKGTIMAIVSYGFSCGKGDQPAVYATIGSFIDWYKQEQAVIQARQASRRPNPHCISPFITLSMFLFFLTI